jgi:hypothetical protein
VTKEKPEMKKRNKKKEKEKMNLKCLVSTHSKKTIFVSNLKRQEADYKQTQKQTLKRKAIEIINCAFIEGKTGFAFYQIR